MATACSVSRPIRAVSPPENRPRCYANRLGCGLSGGLVRRREAHTIGIRTLLEYAALRVVVVVIRSLGPERAADVARRAGDLYRRLDRRHRKVAEDNVRHAFPDRSREERDRIVRESFRGFALGVIEFLYLPRLLTARSTPRRVEVQGLERAREILAGRGAVLVTGHFGNWEVIGATLGFFGAPLNSVARPIDNPLVDGYLLEQRTQYGQRIIAKKGALRALIGVIREGGYLAVLADQDAGRHGIFVDFFGRAASTIPTPAALAVRLGVPVAPGACVRVREKPFTFRLLIDEPLEPVPGANREAEIRRLTQEAARALERRIREYPEQYLWQHRRWKTRPPEESGKTPRKGARWNRS